MANAEARYDAGQAYRQGLGVTSDMIRGRYWLERADGAEAEAVEAAASWAAIPAKTDGWRHEDGYGFLPESLFHRG